MAKVNPIQLQKALKGTKYPATRQALLDSAKNNSADEGIMAAIKELPDTEFGRPSDVSKQVQGNPAGAGDTPAGKSSTKAATADKTKAPTADKSKTKAATAGKSSTKAATADKSSTKAATADKSLPKAEKDPAKVERNRARKDLH